MNCNLPILTKTLVLLLVIFITNYAVKSDAQTRILQTPESFGAGTVATPPVAGGERGVLILLPGYGGSKIYTCLEESSPSTECTNIFGDASSDTRLYDLSIKQGAIYKYGVMSRSEPPYDLYDKLKMFLQKTSGNRIQFKLSDQNYFPIPYDWRRSITLNAEELASELCEKLRVDPGRKFFIVAHSMGGLVLKEWLRSHSQKQCSNGEAPAVRAVAFIGTPHLGSVKTLEALLKGFELFPKYDYKQWFEQISPTIVQSAPWFQSSYELLPVLSSERCTKTLETSNKEIARRLPPTLTASIRATSSPQLVDLYSSSSWKSFNLFRYSRQKAYQLPSFKAVHEWLTSAATLMCSLVEFNPSSRIDYSSEFFQPVSYVVGVDNNKNTPAQVVFSKNEPEPSFLAEQGDGTVTEKSASNILISRTHEVIRVVEKNFDHLKLLDSDEVKNLLASWLSDPSFRVADVRPQEPRGQGARDGISSKPGGAGSPAPQPSPAPTDNQPSKPGQMDKKSDAGPELIPIIPDPDQWRNTAILEDIEENRQRLLAAGMSYGEFLQQSTTLPHSFSRLISQVNIAALMERNSVAQLDLLVDAADSAARIQNSKILFTLARYVANNVQRGPGGQDGLSGIKTKLLSLRADILLKGEIPVASLITSATKTVVSSRDIGAQEHYLRSFEMSHPNMISDANGGTVTIITASPQHEFMRWAYDIASVLDGRGTRVLPVVGRDIGQNIKDIMYLRGIDMGVLRSDVLKYISQNSTSRNRVENSMRYIIPLPARPLLVIGKKKFTSLEQLKGEKVNFGSIGSPEQFTGHVIFDQLGITVDERNLGVQEALTGLGNNDISAMIVADNQKNSDLVTLASRTNELRVIPIPLTPQLKKIYRSYRLLQKDFPALIGDTDAIETIAVDSVLATFNWPRGSLRYSRVEKFTKAIFANFEKLSAPPHDSAWRSVNITADIPGWIRFEPAQQQVDRILEISRDFRSDPQAKAAFDRFIVQVRPIAPSGREEQGVLWRKFLDWRQSTCGIEGVC